MEEIIDEKMNEMVKMIHKEMDETVAELKEAIEDWKRSIIRVLIIVHIPVWIALIILLFKLLGK